MSYSQYTNSEKVAVRMSIVSTVCMLASAAQTLNLLVLEYTVDLEIFILEFRMTKFHAKDNLVGL